MATYFKTISPSGHTAWQARSKITNTFKLEQSDLKPNLIRPPSGIEWEPSRDLLGQPPSDGGCNVHRPQLVHFVFRVQHFAFVLIRIWNCLVLSSSIENDSDFVFRVREVDFWERPEWRDNFPDFSGFIWKRNRSSVCVQFETCGQSYKQFTVVNYNFRVVLTRKLPSLRF